MPRNTDGNLALLSRERPILQAMLRARDSRQKVHINVPKKDEDGNEYFFDFWIRPLSEPEMTECTLRASQFKQDPQAGGMIVPVLDPFQQSLANSYMIVAATIPDPEAPTGTPTIWADPETLGAFDVVDAAEVVDQVLLAYEKMAVVAKINEISGGNAAMAKLVESAKN